MKQVYNRDEAHMIAIPTTQPDYFMLIPLNSNTSLSCQNEVNANKDSASAEEYFACCIADGILTKTLFDEHVCKWDVMPSKDHPFYFAFGEGDLWDNFEDESFEQLCDLKHNLSDFADIKVNGDFVSFEMESIPELEFRPQIWEKFDKAQLDWLREIGQVITHQSIEVPVDMVMRKEDPIDEGEIDAVVVATEETA